MYPNQIAIFEDIYGLRSRLITLKRKDQMKKLNERTSKGVASKAGKMLKKSTSKTIKSISASALSQRKKKK